MFILEVIYVWIIFKILDYLLFNYKKIFKHCRSLISVAAKFDIRQHFGFESYLCFILLSIIALYHVFITIVRIILS